jgi:hypothetical protein
MDKILEYKYLLDVKRGVLWAKRRIEMNKNTFKYYNSKNTITYTFRL